MTIFALPLLNKLSGTYTKTVSFSSMQCKANNQYQRKMGVGKDNLQISYELKYIGLTQSEVTLVENLFSVQNLGDVLSFKSPIDSFARNYAKPPSWQKENYWGWAKDQPYQKLTDLSFTLVLGNELTAISRTPMLEPPNPTQPFLTTTYSASSNRIYAYSPADQKLHIFSSVLGWVGAVDIPEAASSVWQVLASPNNKVLLLGLDAGSPFSLQVFDIPTSTFTSYPLDAPQSVSISISGDDAYIVYYWYTSEYLTKINYLTGAKTTATNVPIGATGVLVAEGYVWVLKRGNVGDGHTHILRYNLDLTGQVDHVLPSTADSMATVGLSYADGKLFFTGTFNDSSPTYLFEYVIATDTLNRYSITGLNKQYLYPVVEGDLLYLGVSTGIMKYNHVSHSEVSTTVTANNEPRCSTSTSIVIADESGISLFPL